MQNQVNQRIRELLEIKNIKPNELAEKLGVSRQYVSQLLNRQAAIGSKPIKKLCELWPDVNLDWLMTGNGQKFNPSNYKKKDDQNNDVNDPEVNYTTPNTIEMIDTIKNLNQLIKLQQEQINQLMERIQDMENEQPKKKRIS